MSAEIVETRVDPMVTIASALQALVQMTSETKASISSLRQEFDEMKELSVSAPLSGRLGVDEFVAQAEPQRKWAKADEVVKFMVSAQRVCRAEYQMKTISVEILPEYHHWIERCAQGGRMGMYNELLRRGIESVEREWRDGGYQPVSVSWPPASTVVWAPWKVVNES